MPLNAVALRQRSKLLKQKIVGRVGRFKNRLGMKVQKRVVVPTGYSGKLSFFKAEAKNVLRQLNKGATIPQLMSEKVTLKHFLAVGCSVKELKQYYSSAKSFREAGAVLTKELLTEFGVDALREAGYQSIHFVRALPLQGMLKAKFTLEELSQAYSGRKLVSGLMNLKRKGIAMPVIGKVKILQNNVLTVENFNRYLQSLSQERNIPLKKLKERKWTKKELARAFIFRTDLIKLGYMPEQLAKEGLDAISPYNLRKSGFNIR